MILAIPESNSARQAISGFYSSCQSMLTLILLRELQGNDLRLSACSFVNSRAIESGHSILTVPNPGSRCIMNSIGK